MYMPYVESSFRQNRRILLMNIFIFQTRSLITSRIYMPVYLEPTQLAYLTSIGYIAIIAYVQILNYLGHDS